MSDAEYTGKNNISITYTNVKTQMKSLLLVDISPR